MAQTRQQLQSRYANDSRVQHLAGGQVSVIVGDVVYRIVETEIFGWIITDPETGQFLHIADDSAPQGFTFAINIDTADDAIGVLIGPPQQ